MLALLHSKLIAKLCIAAAAPLALGLYQHVNSGTADAHDSAIVMMAPGDFSYRAAGEFTRDGLPVNAPLVKVRRDRTLYVMRTQVSAADFDRCVEDGACRAVAPRHDKRADQHKRADLPAVGVSWEDANVYARWLSRKDGRTWRLPTDEEWAWFSKERFTDDAIPDNGEKDFGERWISRYEKESESARAIDGTPKPFGTFGANSAGVLDLAGNVWEWTDTCFVRQAVDAANVRVGRAIENCGVRVVEGRHRAYVTNFIRDAKAGGCAVGVPPANLGFRLVSDDDGIPRDRNRIMARKAAPSRT